VRCFKTEFQALLQRRWRCRCT